ncbi:MAG: lysozyme [Pseudomonadota bacterium]|nr:lysozyme [Pseudomonadota bacterium]
MNREKLAAQLTLDEGRRARVYTDTVGKLTVGVGRNISDRAFSDDEIDLMLDNDIKLVEQALDRSLPWWRQMNDARQNVLANMCFMGIGTLLTFVNTLAAMKDSRYGDAADGMLASKWAKQVGQRANRLADIMRKGQF